MASAAKLAELLKRATDAGDVPGVAVAIADKNGLIYEGASGVRSLDSSAAMTPDTVCWIASMTKAVTGACAMQLVEHGKLALDTPIVEVLPELADVQVLDGFDAAGVPQLRAPKTTMTLRHLLTHTSGYTYDIWSATMKRYQAAAKIPGVITCQNKALSTPLLFDPGERWEYGIGIDWVGKAVEAASGQRLGHYMKSNIFDPLEMGDTGFKLGAGQQARRAAIHLRTPEGLVATPIVLEQNPEFEMGGGGLYSTVSDYAKFARMLLNGGTLDGNRVLGAETVAMMSRCAMGDLRCGPMLTADASSSNTVEFTRGMQWGLSFMINPERLPTGRSPQSLAWAGLANSYYWIDPAKGQAGVFATQILPFADVKALALFQEVETTAYGMM